MRIKVFLQFAIGFLFVAGSLAGCLDKQAGLDANAARRLGGTAEKVWSAADPILSQPLFPKWVFEHFPVKASDGIVLDNWVYRPVTPEGVKVPTIIHLSPYFANNLPAGGGGLERILRDNLTSRGYAVMASSVRGTGFSEGCFEIGGPRERLDYNELFAEVAKQPWSNGNIGLIGVSYDGTAPQGALISSSPHLKTIVPIAAISEWYKYNFVKGVQINPQGWAFNTYYVAYEQAPLNLRGFYPPNANPQNPVGTVNSVSNWKPPSQQNITKWPGDIVTYSSRACATQGSSSNGISRGPSVLDTQRSQVMTAPTGTTDPYWEERNFTRYLDKVRDNVSVLIVHGLIDYNVKTHNLMPWIPELQKHNVPTKMLLGQWGHAYPTGMNNRNGPADWNVTLLRWFDYWLKGIDTGIMAEPAVQIQDYHGVWRNEDNFPPTRANATSFYLNSGNKLQMEAGTGMGTFQDNSRPFNAGDKGAGNAAYYLGDVLQTPFRYSGEAVATIELSHSVPRGHVAVTVYNVTGETWKPVNWGYYNYNVKNDAAKYDPIMPGQKFTLQVPLLPTDMVIPAGSRLGIVFAGQSAGGPGMLPPPSGGTTTIYHGARSHVTFPVIDSITPMDPQPLNMRGDAATFSSG